MMKKIACSAFLALILVGCGDDKGSETTTQKIESKIEQKIEQVESKAEQSVEQNLEQKSAQKAKIKGEYVADYFEGYCSSCHGNYGEKSALNTSKVIANLSEDELVTALKGFKDGTYGGKLAATMKGNIRELDYADLETLAKYIASEL